MISSDQRAELLRELADTRAGAVLTCDSHSMAPTIELGQQVRVRRIPIAMIRVGDVVVHQREAGIYIMHRIAFLSPNRSWFLHAGDAASADGPRRAFTSSILGRVDRQRRRPAARVYLRLLGTWLYSVRKNATLWERHSGS